MTTYINFRNVKSVEREEREFIDKETKNKGIVETLTIKTDDGITTINIFKEVE
jgi:hypothetical protein